MMPLTLQQFADQLTRCAQSELEATAFIEAFARVRLGGITKALAAPLDEAAAIEQVAGIDWSDRTLLAESGIDTAAATQASEPGKTWLHISVAAARDHSVLSTFLSMTGLSDKQTRDLYPILSTQRTPTDRASLAREVQRLNKHLDWIRSKGVSPEQFLVYHRHLAIHGASQNFSGQVGSMGAAIAFVDALREIAPDAIIEIFGGPPPDDCSPEALADYLSSGTRKNQEAKKIRAIALRNGRFIVFSSDPDVSIFMPLAHRDTESKISASHPRKRTSSVSSPARVALRLYNEVRQHADRRRQYLHEFAVGEIKTATDPSNLHERLALGSRETKVEVNADRFLMMALLTRDLLEGGSGRKTGRAPLQNRDTVRFSDVFNLHFAWGWDGSREIHPTHWEAFKARLRVWAGL